MAEVAATEVWTVASLPKCFSRLNLIIDEFGKLAPGLTLFNLVRNKGFVYSKNILPHHQPQGGGPGVGAWGRVFVQTSLNTDPFCQTILKSKTGEQTTQTTNTIIQLKQK
jgi:hypothetical protein